jgi:hypothetical protein
VVEVEKLRLVAVAHQVLLLHQTHLKVMQVETHLLVLVVVEVEQLQ